MTPSPYIPASKRGDWPTPRWLFDALNARFDFTLDAAASAGNALCPRFYDADRDGLAQSWAGERVWLNAPYGRVLRQWIAKARAEGEAGATVVCLVPARTDTKWWHEHVLPAGEVTMIRGRLVFEGATAGAPFPSAIVVFRPRVPAGLRKPKTPTPEAT